MKEGSRKLKVMRKRKVSKNQILGITKAKRSIGKMTGVPTTASGRKRKLFNHFTGGGYGKYERTRAAFHRPINTIKRPPTPFGCSIPLTLLIVAIVVIVLTLWH